MRLALVVAGAFLALFTWTAPAAATTDSFAPES